MAQYNVEIKQSGDGDRFDADLMPVIACCDEAHYGFSFGFNPGLLTPGNNITIEIRGGCANFTWDFTGVHTNYTWANATTSGRTNTLIASAGADPIPITITITDNCSTVLSMVIRNAAPTVSPPTFDPVDGSTVNSTDTITMTTATAGASIYYTKGEASPPDDPVDTDALYSAPVTIDLNKYWKAFGKKSGNVNSEIGQIATGYNVAAPYTFQPAVNGDDGGLDNGAFYSVYTTNHLRMGYQQKSFIRFPNTIPALKTITAAVLNLNGGGASTAGDPVNIRIWFNDVDVPVAPTDVTEYNALVKTTNYVDWDSMPGIQDVVTAPNGIDSPDITTPLQEVINRIGRSGSGAIMMIIENNSSGVNRWRKHTAYEGLAIGPPYGLYAARLVVNYVI